MSEPGFSGLLDFQDYELVSPNCQSKIEVSSLQRTYDIPNPNPENPSSDKFREIHDIRENPQFRNKIRNSHPKPIRNPLSSTQKTLHTHPTITYNITHQQSNENASQQQQQETGL